jgi:hypoxanthine phosphoribosyltransferase
VKISKIINALQDMFADKARKRISEEKVVIYCTSLAREVEKVYTPDLVIAIDTGGSVPGDLVAKDLGVPVKHITIRRDINIGRMYNRDPIPLRWIMSVYHHYLFHTVKPVVSINLDFDISGKKILIVDDSVHTGATLAVAVRYFQERFVSEVRVATLTFVSNVESDFSILPAGNYCFPWSKDFVREEGN